MPKLLWTLKQQIGPRPRVGHAMTYNAAAKATLLFGGFSQAARLADTWQWDGENWTQLDDIGPKARSVTAMAYDTQRQRAVLFGGQDGNNPLGDTWEWDGQDWTQAADSGPSARAGHVMVFDTVRDRVLLFGGTSAQGPLADTWQWDGNEWVQIEDTGPSARTMSAWTFDMVRGRAVLFGGTGATDALGDTWEWDGTTWTQVSSFGPPACLGATLVFTGAKALLFGGISSLGDGATLFANSWEWDGRHWTIRQDMGPGLRWGHHMVFDTVRNRGVLFGGADTAGADAPGLGDTWEQFEQGTGAQPPPLPPSPPTIQSVAADPSPAQEGTPVNVTLSLSNTPPAGTPVTLVVQDQQGNMLLNQQFDSGQLTPVPFPLVLPQGQYDITATLGTSAGHTTLEIAGFPNNAIAELTGGPADVAGAITLNATLTLPAAELAIPLEVALGNSTQIWPGGFPMLTNQVSGTQTFAGFSPGTYTWTAKLGGAERSATVTI